MEIQADLADGLPGVTMIGLPDAALQEARDRIRAAIVNSGETWPTRRMTLALLPATLPKRGSMFDVALAVGVLAAAGAVPADRLDEVVLLGELGLDGRLRSTRGVLPAVIAAARTGIRRVVVPAANLAEATLVPGLDVRGVAELADLLAFLRGDADRTVARPAARPRPERPGPDLRDVVGQAIGRRARRGRRGRRAPPARSPARPAPARRCWPSGCPGCCRRSRVEEALEVTAVHSVAGLLAADAPLVRRPPYQAPHHTASAAALVGGGSRQARPGAASLSHRGISSWTRRRSSRPGCWTRCGSRWRAARWRSPGPAGSRATRPGSSWCMAANPCPCAAPAGEAECRCTVDGPAPLHRADLRAAAGPDGPAGAAGAGGARGTARRAGRGRAVRGGGGPGGGGAGGGGRAAARHAAGGSTRTCPVRRCAAGGGCRRR